MSANLGRLAVALTALVVGLETAASGSPVAAVTPPGEQSGLPGWLRHHMEGMVGRWVTDNAAYRSEQEPSEAYGMEWTWGVGRQTLVGRLFGLTGGREGATFWQFRLFWHPGERRAYLYQFGAGGVLGRGPLWPVEGDSTTTEVQQEFFAPDGSSRPDRHLQRLTADELVTQSFDRAADGWTLRRTYRWRRER